MDNITTWCKQPVCGFYKITTFVFHKKGKIQVWNKEIRVCKWFICSPFYLTFTCSGTHTCIPDLAPRYMVVLRCSLPVCMVTVFEELHAFDSPRLTWVVSSATPLCMWKKRHLFVWKGREPLYLHKNIHAVEFVRWSTWQIHLLSLMSLSSNSYQQ